MNFLEYKGINVFFRTSYFYQIRFMKNLPNMIPISICIWDPKWYNGINYKGLVPKIYSAENDCEACYKIHSDDPLYDGDLKCNYIINYRKQLSKYNVQRTLVDILETIERNVNLSSVAKTSNEGIKEITIVFIGFEVPKKRCSERFIVSEWLNIYFQNDKFCYELEYPILQWEILLKYV